MLRKKKSPINPVALSKKYKCDVGKIIRAWKNGKNDLELSKMLGINMYKLVQIRQDITYAHEKARQNEKKNASFKTSLLLKP
ncbi:MAG TPA: hypothetical protein PLJ33_03350 [Peptococcaceae bacterium]|jgi:hypothetical protein|nr:hypothetical protein [Clostridia bacterium]HOB81568.1 hypothetical protein [Peptococcaceae bacterium]HPZ71016.1 hypothetical protein [Peptococcaceae bacterium]HQD53880.1 hypothetical protein [Peptococcaceae bacterium]